MASAGEEGACALPVVEDDVTNDYEIVATNSGQFETTFYIARQLQPTLIGPNGQEIGALEESTNTIIDVRSMGEAIITGISKESVASTRKEVETKLVAARRLLLLTHFVSIPMNAYEVTHNYLTFKQSILDGPPFGGVENSLFQCAHKLHLTVQPLTILDSKEIIQANRLIVDVCEGAQFENFFVEVKGVEIFKDEPTAAHVLYSNVIFKNDEERQKLQDFCDKVVNEFYRKGWIQKPKDNVKMRVTLMNSMFRARLEGRQREPFDASQILTNYKDYYFGKVEVTSMQLSMRLTTSLFDGYYQSEISVRISPDVPQPLAFWQ